MSRKSALIGSTALATVIGLAMATLAMAAPPGENECRGNSCGSSGFDNSFYYVVHIDTPDELGPAPWSLGCEGLEAATNGSSVNIYFDRHNGCANFDIYISSDDRREINDDIHILVDTNNRNEIISIQIFGQERRTSGGGTIIEETMHRSDVIEIYPPVSPTSVIGDFFTVDINQSLPIFDCGHPLRCKKNTDSLEWVGVISVGHMTYTATAVETE